MSRIFISYRRIDSRWVAGRIYDRLTEIFDKKNVFLDVTNIEPGEDFVEAIKRIVESCDILLAVIGPNWITVRDTSGRRRLEDESDLVRAEIATALRRNIRVIPVLVDDAVMPESDMLPEDLMVLTRRNAKEVSFNRFHADLDSLVLVLQTLLKSPGVTKEAGAKSGSDASSVDTIMEDLTSVLPLTISLETVGGIATPLIKRGTHLPAEQSLVCSTVEDNQSVVDVHLVWGERPFAEANRSLGRFNLEKLAPAPKGVPQIEVLVKVNKALIMTVTAKDKATGRSEVLDSVDLSQIRIPDEMANELEEKPKVRESPRDFEPTSGGFDATAGFEDFFEDIFKEFRGKSDPSLDVHQTVYITFSESKTGKEARITNGAGRLLDYKIPAGIQDGTTLRLRGQGKKDGTKAGDLLVSVRVQNAS